MTHYPLPFSFRPTVDDDANLAVIVRYLRTITPATQRVTSADAIRWALREAAVRANYSMKQDINPIDYIKEN